MGTHRASREDEARREGRHEAPGAVPPAPAYGSGARGPVGAPGPRVVAAPPVRSQLDDGAVVPLRPYGAGVIYRGMGRTVRRAPAQLAAATLLGFAIAAAVGVAFGRVETVTRTDDGSAVVEQGTSVRTYAHTLHRGYAALGSLAVVAAVLVAAVIVPVVLGLVAGRGGRGGTPPGSGVRAGAAAAVLAVVSLPETVLDAEQVPLLLRLPVIAVTLWIVVGFALAPAAAAAEALGPVAACRRSWQLVRRSWWRAFGLSLLFQIVGLVAAGIGGAYGVIAVFRLAPGASLAIVDHPLAVLLAGLGAVSASMTAIGRTLLYVDLRSRAEGLAWSLDASRRGDDRELFGPGGVYGLPGSPPLTATGAPSGW